MKPKLYIETSVISYYTSRPSRDLIVAGHQQITQEWWTRQIQQYEPHVSEVVLDEISRGDVIAAQSRLEAVEGFRPLEITSDVIGIAQDCFGTSRQSQT